MKKLVFLIAAALFLAGCKSDNPALTNPPPLPPPPIDRPTVEQTQDGLQVTYDGRVDILFVIDDSASMKSHQENLSRNIQRFVEELAKVSAIDFHIGYTVSHDRGRYDGASPLVPQMCGGRSEPNWETVGTLRPLKDAEGMPMDGRRFVTKEDDWASILRHSLDPNVNTALIKDLLNTRRSPVAGGCGYGPEEEEMFSPILGLLENRALAPNEGFRRDGAFFVAILISDAKSADVNYGLNPEQVIMRIAAATGQIRSDNRRFRVLSVAMKPGVMMTRNACDPDPAFGTPRPDGYTDMSSAYGRAVREDENPLATLAQLTQDETSSVDQVLSICDADYGDELAQYGAQIKQDTLRDIQIPLPSLPQIFQAPADRQRNLRVFIGAQELERSQWQYNVQTRNGQGAVVTVFGDKVNWDEFPNEKIRVTYVPADPSLDTTQAWR